MSVSSSQKEARRAARKEERNRRIRSSLKTHITKANKAIANGEQKIEERVSAAIMALDKSAEKGVIHRNNAARRKSRLMKKYQALNKSVD